MHAAVMGGRPVGSRRDALQLERGLGLLATVAIALLALTAVQAP